MAGAEEEGATLNVKGEEFIQGRAASAQLGAAKNLGSVKFLKGPVLCWLGANRGMSSSMMQSYLPSSVGVRTRIHHE